MMVNNWNLGLSHFQTKPDPVNNPTGQRRWVCHMGNHCEVCDTLALPNKKHVFWRLFGIFWLLYIYSDYHLYIWLYIHNRAVIICISILIILYSLKTHRQWCVCVCMYVYIQVPLRPGTHHPVPQGDLCCCSRSSPQWASPMATDVKNIPFLWFWMTKRFDNCDWNLELPLFFGIGFY